PMFLNHVAESCCHNGFYELSQSIEQRHRPVIVRDPKVFLPLLSQCHRDRPLEMFRVITQPDTRIEQMLQGWCYDWSEDVPDFIRDAILTWGFIRWGLSYCFGNLIFLYWGEVDRLGIFRRFYIL